MPLVFFKTNTFASKSLPTFDIPRFQRHFLVLSNVSVNALCGASTYSRFTIKDRTNTCSAGELASICCGLSEGERTSDGLNTAAMLSGVILLASTFSGEAILWSSCTICPSTFLWSAGILATISEHALLLSPACRHIGVMELRIAFCQEIDPWGGGRGKEDIIMWRGW